MLFCFSADAFCRSFFSLLSRAEHHVDDDDDDGKKRERVGKGKKRRKGKASSVRSLVHINKFPTLFNRGGFYVLLFPFLSLSPPFCTHVSPRLYFHNILRDNNVALTYTPFNFRRHRTCMWRNEWGRDYVVSKLIIAGIIIHSLGIHASLTQLFFAQPIVVGRSWAVSSLTLMWREIQGWKSVKMCSYNDSWKLFHVVV